jgi:hypothetical protein
MRIQPVQSILITVTVAASLALLPVGAGLTRVASAAPLIPADLYPAHTHVTSLSELSNHQMDCDWGSSARPGGRASRSFT